MKEKLEKAKEILPSTCRVGGKFSTSMAVIDVKLFSNHPKNLNYVYKDSKDLVYVIITAVKNIRGGDTVFYDGVKTYELESRAHVFKHLHGRMIFGPFEKNTMKVLFGEDIDQ